MQRVLTLNCASLPVPAPAGLEAGVELLIINLLVGHCLGSDQLKSLCSNYYIRLLLFCGNIRFNLSFRLTYALHIRLSQIHTKNFLPTFSISFYSLVGVAADYISFKDE